MTHVEGEVDPVRDLEIISEELRLKDEETLEKTLEKMERTVIRANDKKMKPEYVSWYVWLRYVYGEDNEKYIFHRTQ